MLRTNLTARRTFVRLRASKNKPEALFLFGLSVLHLFLYPQKGAVKNIPFFTAPFDVLITEIGEVITERVSFDFFFGNSGVAFIFHKFNSRFKGSVYRAVII